LNLHPFPGVENVGKATTVWLIRHGHAEGVDGRCYGRHDAPLSLKGIEQAKAVATQLAQESVRHIYSSNLRRAIQTAEIIAEPHRLPVQQLAELAEMDFGDLEGMRYEEIEERFPEVFQSWMNCPVETQFPNGENFRQMSHRVLGAFGSLVERHPNEPIGIVAHAGVLRIILCRALAIPDGEFFRLPQPHGAINRVEYSENGTIVELSHG
jgi:alpha-ribazole phosphatase